MHSVVSISVRFGRRRTPLRDRHYTYLVRLIILVGIRWTIRIRVSTRGGNLLFATLSVPTVLLIQNSIRLVPRNLSLRMKSWNLKLNAHTLLVQTLKCVELELHFQMPIYDHVF